MQTASYDEEPFITRGNDDTAAIIIYLFSNNHHILLRGFILKF